MFHLVASRLLSKFFPNFFCLLLLNAAFQQIAAQQAQFQPLPSDFALDVNGVSIGPGLDHMCALQRQPGVDIGGRAVCWGHDGFGKLAAPVDSLFVQVVSAQSFSCGITLDQSVRCWGAVSERDAVVPGLYSQITAATHFACGVMTDGKINCWGHLDSAPPYPKGSGWDHKFVQLSCVDTHCCGLDVFGHAICWGHFSGADWHKSPFEDTDPASNEIIEVFDGYEETFDEFEEVDEVKAKSTKLPVIFKQITTGSYTSCGIRYKDGALQCWGDLRRESLPEVIPGPFRQASAGPHGVCAIYEETDVLKCWGLVALMVPVPANSTWDQVAMGDLATCAVSMTSELSCFGGATRIVSNIPTDLEIA